MEEQEEHPYFTAARQFRTIFTDRCTPSQNNNEFNVSLYHWILLRLVPKRSQDIFTYSPTVVSCGIASSEKDAAQWIVKDCNRVLGGGGRTTMIPPNPFAVFENVVVPEQFSFFEYRGVENSTSSCEVPLLSVDAYTCIKDVDRLLNSSFSLFSDEILLLEVKKVSYVAYRHHLKSALAVLKAHQDEEKQTSKKEAFIKQMTAFPKEVLEHMWSHLAIDRVFERDELYNFVTPWNIPFSPKNIALAKDAIPLFGHKWLSVYTHLGIRSRIQHPTWISPSKLVLTSSTWTQTSQTTMTTLTRSNLQSRWMNMWPKVASFFAVSSSSPSFLVTEEFLSSLEIVGMIHGPDLHIVPVSSSNTTLVWAQIKSWLRSGKPIHVKVPTKCLFSYVLPNVCSFSFFQKNARPIHLKDVFDIQHRPASFKGNDQTLLAFSPKGDLVFEEHLFHTRAVVNPNMRWVCIQRRRDVTSSSSSFFFKEEDGGVLPAFSLFAHISQKYLPGLFVSLLPQEKEEEDKVLQLVKVDIDHVPSLEHFISIVDHYYTPETQIVSRPLGGFQFENYHPESFEPLSLVEEMPLDFFKEEEEEKEVI